MNIEELKKRITEHRIRLSNPSKKCINEIISFLDESNGKEEVELSNPGLNPSLLSIDSLQQAIKSLHRDMYNLQQSYKRDSEDQWKLISELRVIVEKLEEKK